MDKLARKALNVATSVVKRGCAEELAELLNDELIELVTVNTETGIPCNLVRKFRDHRPNDASDDSEDGNETACLAAKMSCTGQNQICALVFLTRKRKNCQRVDSSTIQNFSARPQWHPVGTWGSIWPTRCC